MMACMKSVQNCILRETFLAYPSLSLCNLSLTESVLFVEGLGKGDCEDVRIADIVGCQCVVKKEKRKKNGRDASSSYLRVYYYPLRTSSGILYKQLRRERQAAKFVMNKFDTYEQNFQIVNKWKRTLLWLVRGVKLIRDGEVLIPECLPAPQRLLFLLNPHSGSGKATFIFKEQVLPLLEESDIQYEVIITDKANCARDFMKTVDLCQWNGIVTVSGDGLLFEVYNGLMEREDWDKAVKMPLGVIPGGSGNGLARAISHATGEPYDTAVVTPSVLNVVRGRISPMDLVRVQSPYGEIYSFLSIGWGLMADIDVESEKLRAIGEARFAVWAVIRALGLRTYKGKLSYLPVRGYKAENGINPLSGPKMKRSKTVDSRQDLPRHITKFDGSNNMFRSKSFSNEISVLSEGEGSIKLLQFSSSSDFSSESKYAELTCHRNCGQDQCPTRRMSNDKGCSYHDGHPTSPSSILPPLTEPVPENWTVLEGEFVMVYVCHQTHLGTDLLLAPDARLDDGIMWLVLIRSGVSRAKVIYFLSSLQTGDHVHIPYVDVIPIHAFRLEPEKNDGVLTVDGEVIPCSPIQAEVLPSIARIITR